MRLRYTALRFSLAPCPINGLRAYFLWGLNSYSWGLSPHTQVVLLPILYSFRRCPYAMRARLALYAANQRCELREVVLRDKPRAMLDASPKGTVPVLVLPSGEVIDESLDIMLWALTHSDPDNWLKPPQGTTASALAFVNHWEQSFKPHLDRYKYATRYKGADPLKHREQASKLLWELDERLQGRLWLSGEHLSLTDAALAPFVRQFANTDTEWFSAQPWFEVCRWLEAFLRLPIFLQVMTKFSPWHPDDEAVYIP